MRLNEKLRQEATKELLTILASLPEAWVPTKELIGTPCFHGERTLTSRQVISLLRASDQTREKRESYGRYTQVSWALQSEK